MKHNKAQLSSMLVILVIGLVSLLVLLMITGSFNKLFKTVSGKSDCQMQFLISSFTKFGGAQTIEPECEPHLVTITNEELIKNKDKIQSDLRKYKEKYIDDSTISDATKATVTPYIKTFFSDEDKGTREWNMNKKIADEMKYCWDVTGKGKLDLFSNWGTIMCIKDEKTPAQPCTNAEIKDIYERNKGKAIIGGIVGGVFVSKLPLIGGSSTAIASGASSALITPIIWERLMGNIKEEKNPTFCVLCARIKFDDATKNQFPNEINSMGLWLANNPVTDVGDYSKVSYAQYLKNDAYQGVFAGEFSYAYTPNKAYAVLYERINIYQPKNLEDQGIRIITGDNSDKPKDIQMIKLVPYQNISNECTFLVG